MRPSAQQPISKDKNIMVQTRKYYLKNHYLTLKSKSQEGHYGMWHTALRSCANIPNIIDLSRKKQLFDLEVKGQGPTKVIMVCDTPPYGHAHTHQISLAYLERQKCYSPDNKILLKNIIWPWGQRSRSHEGHYGTWHTTLWSCTHIWNISDLSRKTKQVMVWTSFAEKKRKKKTD